MYNYACSPIQIGIIYHVNARKSSLFSMKNKKFKLFVWICKALQI